MKSIRTDVPAELPPSVSPFISGLVYELLEKNPEKRPVAAVLIKREQINIHVTKLVEKVI